MIINRRTLIVKGENMAAAAELLAAELKRINLKARVFIPILAPLSILAFEAEYESLAEYERFTDEWSASGEAAVFLEKMRELIEIGDSNEIWKVIEV